MITDGSNPCSFSRKEILSWLKLSAATIRSSVMTNVAYQGCKWDVWSELSMGPYHRPRPNPTQPTARWIYGPRTQPNPYPTQPPYNEQQSTSRKTVKKTVNFQKTELLLPKAKLVTCISYVVIRDICFSQICHFRPMAQPNPLKIKILDPLATQPNPTHGSTQPVDNSAYDAET